MYKKVHLLKNILLSNFLKLPAPYKVTFALTYRCNLRCKICGIWEKPSREELTVRQIEKIFSSLNNLSWLDLTGGEVTMREDAENVIDAILKNSPKLSILHLSTNGQQPQRVLRIVNRARRHKGILIVNVSIDGPQKIHDDLRGAEGAYEKSIETFSCLKKSGIAHAYISCTLSDHNVTHAEKLISELKRDIPAFKTNSLHFNIFHQSAHYYKNHDVPPQRANAGLIKKYFSRASGAKGIKRILHKCYSGGLSKYLSGQKFPSQCQALRSTLFIDPYGEVYPCTIYNKPLGNARNFYFDVRRMWNSEMFNKARKDITNRLCPGCWTPCEAYPALLGNLKSAPIF